MDDIYIVQCTMYNVLCKAILNLKFIECNVYHYNSAVLPTARKFGQITQSSPNFKPQGGEKFWPNFLFSKILAENSPNYQSSVLISIIFT